MELLRKTRIRQGRVCRDPQEVHEVGSAVETKGQVLKRKTGADEIAVSTVKGHERAKLKSLVGKQKKDQQRCKSEFKSDAEKARSEREPKLRSMVGRRRRCRDAAEVFKENVGSHNGLRLYTLASLGFRV